METAGRVRPRHAVLGAAACGVAVLVATAMTSRVHVAPSNVTLAVLDTVASLAALLAAFLVAGRFRMSGLAREAALALALLLLAGGNLLFSVLPAVIDPQAAVTGEAVVSGMLAAASFLVGSVLPARIKLRWRQPAGMLGLIGLAAVLLVAAWAVGGSLPGVPGDSRSADAFGAAPTVVYSVVQGLAAGLFALSAVGCLRNAERDGDQLMAAFALGAVLAAVSRLEFAIAESPSSLWALGGHIFRLEFYLVLVIGAGAEISRHWRRAADAAVLEERRRIARELHDGLAQELAFIAGQSAVLAGRPTAGRREHMLRGAAERALDESRRAIAALTRPLDEPLDVALAQTVEEVADRLGMRALFEMDGSVDAPAETKEALLRITREAITNAGRHGEATRVTVQLANGEGLSLRVVDNGRGFDPVEVSRRSGGVGMSSMRERAEALGGRVSVSSRPYGGTVVEVWVPCGS